MMTHDITINGDVVIKRFRSWARDEPAREWAALRLLARRAGGLAPRPLSPDLDADPPVITMSRLPGRPLASSPISPAMLDALALALDRLWTSAGPADLSGLPVTEPGPIAFVRLVGERMAAGPDLGDDPVVLDAAAAAVAWLRRAADWPRPDGRELVLGQADANLANFLYADGRVRLVDFEDCRPSNRPFELAVLVEHLSFWAGAGLDADDFLARFDLTAGERRRLLDYRPVAALHWLYLLRPGSRTSGRNPPGTLARQAGRLRRLLDDAG
jgi:prepilin-type processing-associated H-X9-DG protein